MEPENNMENKAPGTTTSGITEMTTEKVVVTGAEPVVNEVPKGDIVLGSKPKKKTGVILGMILLFLLAAGGIGFGIFAWMDGNAQRDNLNSQVNALKEQNSKLLEQLGNEGKDVIVDIETETDSGVSSNVNTADYIYVGEWGIKIKKGSDLRLVSMDYRMGHNTWNNFYSLSAASAGLLNKIEEMGVSHSSFSMLKNVYLFRTTNSMCSSVDRGEWDPVYNDGEYNYCIYVPASAVDVEYSSYEDEIWSDLYKFRDILNDAQNYSKI